MKQDKRSFAVDIGLKLTYLKRIRLNKTEVRCCQCLKVIEKKEYKFVVLGYKDLMNPIDAGPVTIRKVPFVYQNYCILCSRKHFPGCYKKIKELIAPLIPGGTGCGVISGGA